MGEKTDFASKREPSELRRDNVIQAGVDPETWRRFEDWRVGHELTASEATRRLLRTGLDVKEGQPALRVTFPTAIVVLGLWLVTLAWMDAAEFLGYVGAALVPLAFLYHYRNEHLLNSQ